MYDFKKLKIRPKIGLRQLNGLGVISHGASIDYLNLGGFQGDICTERLIEGD
jgi:hypothetical protein